VHFGLARSASGFLKISNPDPTLQQLLKVDKKVNFLLGNSTVQLSRYQNFGYRSAFFPQNPARKIAYNGITTETKGQIVYCNWQVRYGTARYYEYRNYLLPTFYFILIVRIRSEYC
jgi:hypothetical protein